MRVSVIIPAAGRSERFGASDKLQQDLGGRPLLLRTVEAFAKRDEVIEMLVAAPPDDFDAFRERYAATLSFHGGRVVEGSVESRAATVRSALREVADDASHVAIHDAARPVVSQELLARVFRTVESLRAVAPAIPITSTIKQVDEAAGEVAADEDGGLAQSILGDAGRVTDDIFPVLKTIDRTGLMEVQTPQVFSLDLIRRAYVQPLDGATDDAMLVERLGEPVHLVVGDRSNIKVTTPEDIDLVRAILRVKPPAERPVHKRF